MTIVHWLRCKSGREPPWLKRAALSPFFLLFRAVVPMARFITVDLLLPPLIHRPHQSQTDMELQICQAYRGHARHDTGRTPTCETWPSCCSQAFPSQEGDSCGECLCLMLIGCRLRSGESWGDHSWKPLRQVNLIRSTGTTKLFGRFREQFPVTGSTVSR